MSFYPSTEVRWFGEGPAPSYLITWFKQCIGPWQQQAPRTDFYLAGVHSDALGIKIREGRLELKQRQGEREIKRFHPQIVGLLEEWQKWGFVLSDSQQILKAITPSSNSWIGVYKERMLRRYFLSDNGRVEPVAGGEVLEQGCQLELTGIRIDGRSWWSLGFEAFGVDAHRLEILEAVAGQLFKNGQHLDLTDDSSYGYPQWLTRAV